MRQKELLYYMLAEYYEKGCDFLDSLLPFIEFCLSENAPSKLTADSLKQLVENEYPFDYPLAVYEGIIRKFVHNGILAQIEHEGAAYFEPVKGFKAAKIGLKRQEFQRSVDLIGLEFIKFAKDMDREYSLHQAKKLVVDFLINNLESMLSVENNKLVSPNDLQDEDKLVSMFLIEEFEKETDTIRCVNVIIKGVLCYNFIYYKRDKHNSNDLSNLKVFLDTAIVIYALGYAGDIRKKLASELIAQLKKRNAQVYCYEHSLREILNSLTACEYIIQSRDSGFGAMRYTVEYFLSQPDSLTAIMLAAHNLESDIEKKAEIKVFKESLYENQDRKPFINEVELASILAQEMHVESKDYDRVEADAKSINLTSYLRNGICTNELAEARAVFITQNTLFAKISCGFLNESKFTIPTIFHYSSFSTLLLLSDEVPEPNLPLIIVIENCYAAVAPSDTQWKAYIEKLNNKQNDGTITDIDYLKLRSMGYARKPLFKYELDHTPITMISIEEVQRFDEERIKMEAEKVRNEERIAASLEVESAINDMNIAITERNDMFNGINKMKLDRKRFIHKLFLGSRIIFTILFVCFSVLAVFTQISKLGLWMSAIVSSIGMFATFFPVPFFNIEERLVERSNRKIDRYFNNGNTPDSNI